MQIIYCYDAYDAWSYAFSSIVFQLKNYYGSQLRFEVYSGGLIIGKSPVAMGRFSEQYLTLARDVPADFGDDFLWHVQNPGLTDWFPDSLKPAVALAVFREYYPGLQLEFANDLGVSLFREGRDLCDNEAYRHLLEKYGIVPEEFFIKMNQQDFIVEAKNDFEVVKQISSGGYPSLLVQVSSNQFAQLCVGYTALDEIITRLEKYLK